MGAMLKQLPRARGASSQPRSTIPSWVIPHEDSSQFNFADIGGPEDNQSLQDHASQGSTPILPREQPIPDERPDPECHHHPESTHCWACQSNPARRLIETAYAVLDETDAVEDYKMQALAEDPTAFVASKSDLDTLHFNKAMNAVDLAEFKTAMLQEVNAHTENDHREVWEKASMPAGLDVLPAVWAFKRKQQIDTRKVYKYKARLNIHGGMQKHGVNYWETYSQVVNWFSIWLCLIMALLFKWKTRQIDFVLAFLQAEVECDLFMHLPRGLIFSGVHCSTHCLKLKKDLYGSCQADRVWYQHLVNGLGNILKFKQSVVDECVFYQGTTVLLIYVDNGILCGTSTSEMQTIINKLGDLFNITDEGEVDAYLGLKISRPKSDTIKLKQPHLIQQILDDMGMKPNTKTKDKAAPSLMINNLEA
jgi:hypothetical protein